MEKTILDHIAIYLFRKFQYTKIMAINMCEPRNFIIGNITKRLMRFANEKMIADSVDRLNVIKDDVIVEVGSGTGQSLSAIIKNEPKKIFALEISKTFLADLRSNFHDERIEVLGKDAKDLRGFIENETVDKILLINVIYFLDPIKEYLSEFERILKMNGTILITGKFGPASKMDKSVFKNTDLSGLLSILENYFDVSSEFVDLGEPISQYHAIKLTKK